MIKVFIPDYAYNSSLVFEIFEAKDRQKPKISRQASAHFSEVEDPAQADWILVPLFITSLTSPKGQQFLKDSALLAKNLNKPFGVFSNSDLIVNPGVDNVFIFTPGAYRSVPNQIDLPALLPYDPVEKWLQGNWKPLEPQEVPSLGFCGQATVNPLKTAKDFWKFESLRVKTAFGKSPYLHIPRFLPAFERGLLLRSLEKSKLIKTDFILRSKYKGGASTPEQKQEVERDFYFNIYDNLFTVCLRGFGNYSVRFFQTLAMGRIPILIDTDSNVPFLKFIEEEFFVRVPYAQRGKTDRLVLEFLKSKSPEELRAFQERGRKIWEKFYQAEGMISYVHAEMEDISKRFRP